MKKLTFLLLLIPVLTFGQYIPEKRYRIQIPEPVKVIGLYTASVVLEAIGDGLYDDGQKQLGKSLQAVSLGMLLVSPAVLDMDRDNFWWYLVSYVSLRIGLFDYTYNVTRGLPLDYIGDSSYTDKVLQEFNPPHQLMVRGVFFTLGIVIPINEL